MMSSIAQASTSVSGGVSAKTGAPARSSVDSAAPASRARERRANFSNIIDVIPLLLCSIRTVRGLNQRARGPGHSHIRGTISGAFEAGNVVLLPLQCLVTDRVGPLIGAGEIKAAGRLLPACPEPPVFQGSRRTNPSSAAALARAQGGGIDRSSRALVFAGPEQLIRCDPISLFRWLHRERSGQDRFAEPSPFFWRMT